MVTNCVNCGCSQISCGCKDSFLTTPPPCPTPADCPTAQPCSEVFDAQCVSYTGTQIDCNAYTIITPNTSVADALVGIIDYVCLNVTVQGDITCDQEVVVAADTLVTSAIEDVVTFFCTQQSIAADIECGTDLVVAQGTLLAAAIEDVVSYFCNVIDNLPTYVVDAGDGIAVSGGTVGNETTFTVTATNKLKFVKEITTNFDGAALSITQTELNACGMFPTICSATPVEFSDCSITLWWLDGTTWRLLQPYESVTQYWIAQVDDVTGTIGIGITRPMAGSSYRLRAVLIF